MMDSQDHVTVINLWAVGFMVTREINGYRLFSMMEFNGTVFRGNWHTDHLEAVKEAYNAIRRDVRALCREIEGERR